ncbi:MAG TPA: zinc metalloprotease [Nakamurella multipartita]|nr:zinc metalloprotease [Nakamurella multipartita]
MARSCGAVQNYFRQVDLFPQLRVNQAQLESQTRALRQGAPSDFPTDIPVVVHVLDHSDATTISDAQVASQIEVLNEDYAGTNADLSKVPAPFAQLVGRPGLSFHLATQDPAGQPTTGITRTRTAAVDFGVDDTMKKRSSGGADAWDTTRYLNLWVCGLRGGVLGYAQFPGGDPATDGVVIATAAFGRQGSAKAPFDLGRTATHEIGHYLNLSHIWGEARVPTCDDTDFVGDTPNQLGPNSGKPRFPKVSCPAAPNGDMFMNYMDYVDDDSMFMFSQQQVERMHAALQLSRSGLGASLPVPAAG